MDEIFLSDPKEAPLPIWGVKRDALDSWLDGQGEAHAAWVKANGFKGASGRVLVLPGEGGKPAGALLGLGDGADPFATGALARALPAGGYHLAGGFGSETDLALLGFALGTYSFERYKTKPSPEKPAAPKARLLLPEGADRDEIARIAEAVFFARDLISTPPNDMGPKAIEQAARDLATGFGAEVSVIVGDDLLDENYPMVHAVGRASAEAPRLIDIRWGNEHHPKVTLVGKGVAFDTGGLNLKPASGMALMKKDMGGAACVLALAQLVMSAELPVRLRVLVPAVENSVSGNAFRPSDILPSRKGINVEIGNTDAEGRLILADALAEADTESPDLLIDLATLTGAARVALGPDLPPYYTDDDALAEEIRAAAAAVYDPLWRMPLWAPYTSTLDSSVADISHISSGPFAGSITAALFLKRFVEDAKAWVHFDIYGWMPKAKPGRPVGGEAQAVRALYHVLKRRYG